MARKVQAQFPYLFSNQSYLVFFLIIPIRLVFVSNNCPGVYNKVKVLYVIERQHFCVFGLFWSWSLNTSQTLCPQPFTTHSSSNIFLTLPFQFIVVTNDFTRFYNNFVETCIIERQLFSFLGVLCLKISNTFQKLSVLARFLRSLSWTYFWNFHFSLLLFVINVIGYTINLRRRISL